MEALPSPYYLIIPYERCLVAVVVLAMVLMDLVGLRGALHPEEQEVSAEMEHQESPILEAVVVDQKPEQQQQEQEAQV
jgi:hypothetical protein